MSLFQYEPLDLTGQSFRLLMLHPGSTSQISCDIFQASLDLDVIIPYEALSYAWGSTELSASITANGETLCITNNLFTALKDLRDDFLSRVMWIDAICIDQNNIAERGHQVGQMASIYRKAEQVVIWLGPSTFERKLLLECLRKLQQGWKRQKSHADLTWAQKNGSAIRHSSDLDQAVFADVQRNALVSLLDEPWFTRIWVLQEVSNARAASIYCGRWSIQASTLNIAAKVIGVAPDDGCQAVLDLFPDSFTRRSPRKNMLSVLLQRFRKSKASDPRDMVYALLAIASDVSQSDSGSLLLPDYFKTEEQLVQDLKKYLFLDLRYCKVILARTMVSFLEELPQWTGRVLNGIVAAGIPDHIRTLLERGQKFTVNKEVIDKIHHWRPAEALSNLSQVEHPNFQFDLEGVESSLELCDYATAEKLLRLYGEKISINPKFLNQLLEIGRKKSLEKSLERLARCSSNG
ncbi:HET domain-containing protein [Colletotrichum orchidophilum]|uniref:HET domain-containing protein n=1 Tax=Colletotrichum orchidophilum TaxID=1209926 RepID=A0A1G4B0F4_9PEZI|nr:HET domain-containing protein [Colletotrichum orchidophilum]OHE94782.1 HET domain-containing protein [Colletotrichum orchidophilum]